MKRWLLWLLAVPILPNCYVIKNNLDGKYEYSCECFQDKRECIFPECDNDQDRCKDSAESLNEAHEMRTRHSQGHRKKERVK